MVTQVFYAGLAHILKMNLYQLKNVMNLMRYFKLAVYFVFTGVFACVSHAQHLKVDISTTGQSRGHAPNFTQWIIPINSGGTQTATFGSLEVRLDMNSPSADS